MATNFSSNTIAMGGSLKPTLKNVPTDIRTRIETIADVNSIPLPYIGMIFYVVDEDKYYKVKTLKDKVIASVVMEQMLVGEYEPLFQSNDDLVTKNQLEEIIANLPKLEFSDNGDLTVTIGGVSQVYAPKGAAVEPEEPVEDHSGDLRIAQVYGAGGKTDGMLTNDFIELYNMGEHDIQLKDINIMYTPMCSSARNAWQLISLPDVVLPSKHSFLIQGQVNRQAIEGSDVPMQVAKPDFNWGGEIENSGYKVVLTKATQAYESGLKDPFTVDETIIDHIYASADDKTHYYTLYEDVEIMLPDVSKNNGAMQKAEGVWDAADYKTSEDLPQNADLLPHNMAHGAHDLIKLVGPSADKEVIVTEALILQSGDYTQVALYNPVDNFVVTGAELNDVDVELTREVEGVQMPVFKVEGDQLHILSTVLLELVGEIVEVKVQSDKYYRIKFNLVING